MNAADVLVILWIFGIFLKIIGVSSAGWILTILWPIPFAIFTFAVCLIVFLFYLVVSGR